MPAHLEVINPVRNSVDADKKTKISNGVNPMELLDKGVSFEEITREFQNDLIKKALVEAGGNKIKAAGILKMNKKTLYRKIKSLKL
jgi:DNA-binding NtrC family response regulator